MDNSLHINTPDPAAHGHRERLAGIGDDSEVDTDLIGQMVASFYFFEVGHRELFEEHAAHVVSVLRQLGREISPASIAVHFAPGSLEDLSYALPPDQGMNLRRYLAELPGWVVRYLADADEFSQQTLRRRGFVPTVSAN